MAQVAYNPMHPPEKVVSQEDMWKTLAKHVPEGSLKPPKAGESPKEKLLPLEWKPPVRTHEGGAGYMESQCGRFSITKDGHKDTGFTYTAWRKVSETMRNGKPYKEMPIHLGVFKVRADAEAICRLENDRA